MSNKRLRQIFRWAHIVEGSLIAAYVYSASLRANDLYTVLIQFVVVPAVIISGLLMWQQARVNRFVSLRRKANQRASA
jgi:predicted methyltransferase